MLSAAVRFEGGCVRVSWVCLLLVVAGCREQGLVSAMGKVHLEPTLLDFGHLYPGQTAEAMLTVRNDGATPRALQWHDAIGATMQAGTDGTITWRSNDDDEAFASSGLPASAPSGRTEFTVTFAPNHAGTFTTVLELDVDGSTQRSNFTGVAIDAPACPQPVSCHTATFDVQSGQCVESLEPDGTVCDTHSACMTSSTCQQGRCVGAVVSCDDQNACTVDICNAVTGCEHVPAPPCPGDGSCQVGVCDPASGCGFASASDGTACGPMQTCDAAQVCIAGDCVVRNPPDGYVCAQASPCQGEGRCSGSTCQRGPATVLTENWSFDSAATGDVDAGVAAQQLHDFVLEPSGALSMMGFFQTAPQLRVNTAHRAQAEGPARRCMVWNNRLICADYPAAVNGKVSAIDLASGSTVWTFDLRLARPDFNELTSTLFLGRLAVQGSDRLAALYEAYPKGATGNVTTNCRLYFLVVLDASGNMVSAQKVNDPVLDVCDHPHPYGFGADAAGNLFVSFSQTIGMPAPLIPGSPTAVMSFSRDGVFRWKFTDSMLRGGELAVATGLLYPENSSVALSAATGQPIFSISAPFGRLVVTRSRSVPSPLIGASSLTGYEAGTHDQRWVHRLQQNQTFWSEEIRLANWATRSGSRTVALTFTQTIDPTGLMPSVELHGIDTNDGSEAFTCAMQLGYRTGPQLAEVADGSLAVMEGSDACGKCDPPYASSSAAFHTFTVPLISVAQEPWIGTFGGAGHDHREEVLFTAPVGQ